MPQSLFVWLCAAAVIALLFAERRDDARLRAIFKSVASVAFLMAGLSGGAAASPMNLALVAGLAFSAAGDIFLLSRRDRCFLAGMAAFGVGHVAYAGAFILGGFVFGLEAATAAGMTLGAGLVFVGPMRTKMGALATAVGVYVLVISTMVGLSIGHFMSAGTTQSLQLAVGAAAFAASDLSVARDRFVRRDFLNRLWGLPLYYGAQLLIATAV
ncbi:MAG: lysoplasmalogenase [Parvularculaceae bacterium]|nr:lysoplasmalogenase [Parvularculaceae bacterium]